MVGYGLDFGEYYRNLPFIGVLRRELYETPVNRRALGRGRVLIFLGSIISVVGLFPAWWIDPAHERGGTQRQRPQGAGIIIFLAVARDARRGRHAVHDARRRFGHRPAADLRVLALLSITAFLFRVYEIRQLHQPGLPTEAPGLWITGVGLVLVAWGTAEMLTEKPPIYRG